MPDDSLTLLQKLGFTAYEAKAWLALAQAVTLTGYEVAKHSNIPRANIYPVLKRLVERGAARQVEAHDGTRYAATPAPELLENMRREQQSLFAEAQAALPRQPQPQDEQPVYALPSVEQAHARTQRLIADARQSLFIALHPQEAGLLADALRAADERGVTITTLCMEACVAECGGCRGTIHRCELAADTAHHRWLLAVADHAVTVAAEFDDRGGVRAIETHQPLVVQLVTSYIRQSAALAVLGGALGDRFQGLVSLQARRLLEGLRPEEGFPQQAAQATTGSDTPRPETGNQQEV